MGVSFTPAANTFAPGGLPEVTTPLVATQTFAIDGTISTLAGNVAITKGSAAAITLPAPDYDGQDLTIVSESAYAHVVTNASPGFNNSGGTTTITFSGVAGDSVQLRSRGGAWWIIKSTGAIAVNYRASSQVASTSTAITIKNGIVEITKGSIAALTLAAPTATTDDGARLTIQSSTAFAHTITNSTPGFNNVAANTVITMVPAAGSSVELLAYQGVWYIVTGFGTVNTNYRQFQLLTGGGGDKAVTIKNGVCLITKGTAGTDLTIAAPTATTDDGAVLDIVTTTAAAHVVTSAVDGFNAKGSSGTATWAAAIGNTVRLIAYQGHWYTLSTLGVTIA